MLSYELCKQLKDAGFPQKNYIFNSFYKNGKENNTSIFIDDDIELKHGNEIVYCPTLEELINECGDEFERLVHGDYIEGEWESCWIADYYKKKICKECKRYDSDRIFCIGYTPSEAVANLWLALNKK